MSKIEITFCNRAYADLWFKDIKRSSPSQYSVIEAILEEIAIKDGGDIKQAEIFKRHPDVARYLGEEHFRMVPGAGQLLTHNGRGIRHAKYSPSKNIAIIWEKIGDIIYVTFDDHAPVRYHRAISHLRDIGMGKRVSPKRARNSSKFLQSIQRYRRERHIKGRRKFIDLYSKHYR